MNKPLEKFRELLRELFQFDSADLDFGIYRIMNYKREAIERFITHDLPQATAQELDRGVLAEQTQAAQELAQTAQQIRDALGAEALRSIRENTRPNSRLPHPNALGKRGAFGFGGTIAP